MLLQDKWYLETWVICLCFAFWFLGIPFMLGMGLLVIQNNKNKKARNLYDSIDNLKYRRDSLEKEVLQLKNDVKKLNTEKDNYTRSMEEFRKNFKATADEEIEKLNEKFDNDITKLAASYEQQMEDMKKKLEDDFYDEQFAILDAYNEKNDALRAELDDLIKDATDNPKKIKYLPYYRLDVYSMDWEFYKHKTPDLSFTVTFNNDLITDEEVRVGNILLAKIDKDNNEYALELYNKTICDIPMGIRDYLINKYGRYSLYVIDVLNRNDETTKIEIGVFKKV